MEGLIPMVFKAIKTNKTRRQYRRLSKTGAQAYILEDFYDNNNNSTVDDRVHDYGFTTPSRKVESGGFQENRGLRRYQSYGGGGERYLSNGGHELGEVNDVSFYDPNKKQQLKRFRSHRMFAFAGC